MGCVGPNSACLGKQGPGCTRLSVIPRQSIGITDQAGAVNVLYGGGQGLTGRDQLWYQGNDGLQGTAEASDRFGYALAALPHARNNVVYLPTVLRNYQP